MCAQLCERTHVGRSTGFGPHLDRRQSARRVAWASSAPEAGRLVRGISQDTRAGSDFRTQHFAQTPHPDRCAPQLARKSSCLCPCQSPESCCGAWCLRSIPSRRARPVRRLSTCPRREARHAAVQLAERQELPRASAPRRRNGTRDVQKGVRILSGVRGGDCDRERSLWMGLQASDQSGTHHPRPSSLSLRGRRTAPLRARDVQDHASSANTAEGGLRIDLGQMVASAKLWDGDNKKRSRTARAT
eukprot:scaffold48_cov311-Pinguiococcus_pyrenoidosus.AAC.116